MNHSVHFRSAHEPKWFNLGAGYSWRTKSGPINSGVPRHIEPIRGTHLVGR